MSRFLVTVLFLAVTGLTALSAFHRVEQLFGDWSPRTWAVAGYWILKTVIIAAFCFFVAVRDEPRRRSRNPVAFLAFAVALGAIVLLRQPSGTDSTTLVLIGDLVAFASCLWLLAAVLALGKCFGMLPEARGLVTRGPYAIVRHPIYVGEFGTFAGFLIAAPTAWNLLAILTFCAAQATRMRLEEQALTREFPEYTEYAARTPLVVPRVRRYPWRPLAGSRAS
jgi:protein-S-isoprenylcysteine O-methyltransferase Ste14